VSKWRCPTNQKLRLAYGTLKLKQRKAGAATEAKQQELEQANQQLRAERSKLEQASQKLRAERYAKTAASNKHTKAGRQARDVCQDRDNERSFWSNDPLPLLYGMPNVVQSQMPEMQKKLIDEINVLLSEAGAKEKAVNNLARDVIDKKVEARSREFYKRYWAELCQVGRIDGWIGCLKIARSDEITVNPFASKLVF